MDFIGKVQSIAYSMSGKPLITLELDRVRDVNEIHKLNTSDPCSIKIKDHNGRSNQQNNYMWAIIADIDIAENEEPTEDGRWEIYTYGIEAAGVDYEDYLIPKGAVKIIKTSWRASRILAEYDDGTVVIRCFTGSSEFNKKEMGELIDWFLRYAAKHGIPIQDYRNGIY